MPSFLSPDMSGISPFTATGLSLALSMLLLLWAVHPLALLAGRMAGLLNRKGTFTAVDGASANALGSGSLFYGDVVIPGYSVFALGLWSVFSGTSRSVFAWLGMGEAAAPGLQLTAYIAIGLFVLTGALDNHRSTWTHRGGGKAASILYGLALLALAAGFLQSGFNVEWALGVTAASYFSRMISALLFRGLLLHGLGAILYVPVMSVALVLVTLVASYFGPFFMAARKIAEKPRAGGRVIGVARAQDISFGRGNLPANHALDSLDGMLTPR